MPTEREIAGPLAQAFASGRIAAEELLQRGQCVVGKARWLKGLVARVVARFGAEYRPRLREIFDFLLADPLFLRACERWDEDRPLGFVPPVARRLPPALASIAIPKLITTGDVARWLGMTPSEMAWLADERHLERTELPEPLRHYRTRWVRKRGSTARLIESPKPRLKAIQRRILREILDLIPPHLAAHGFRRGRGIVSFAAPHVGRHVVLKMDLRDFFPTISTTRIRRLFLTLGYSQGVAGCLAGLCTTWTPGDVFDNFPFREDPPRRFEVEGLYRKPHLPQGAPTSPALANLSAYRLDARLTGLAARAGAIYTRYADDLVFSGDAEFARAIRRFIVQVGALALDEGFQVNFRKTRVMRRGLRQRAAGLVLNDHVNVARDDYERLKATLTNCVRHGLESQNREQHPNFRAHLEGRIAFVAMVNPHRAEKLQRLWDRIS